MINVQIDTTKEGKCALEIAVEGTAGVLTEECAAVIGYMTLTVAETLKKPLEETAMVLGRALPRLAARAQEQEESSEYEGKETDDERIKENVEELLRESGACRGDNAESTDD